jgi:hypothetical protein
MSYFTQSTKTMTFPIRRYLSFALFLSAMLLLTHVGFGQEEAAQAPAGTNASKTFLDVIAETSLLGKLIWLMILGTSITMVTLIVQNIITLKPSKLAPPPLVQSLQHTIGAGNYQEAWEICNQNKNYLANVLKAALSRIGRGKEAVEDAVAEHGLREATLIAHAQQLSLRHRCRLANDGSARHGHRHDGRVRGARPERHLESPGALGENRRGAHGDRHRSLHRHPGVRGVLYFPQYVAKVHCA